MASDIQCIDKAQASLGEGPTWVAAEQALYWVDIHGATIHRFDPLTQDRRTFPAPCRIGSLVPRAAGGFAGGCEQGFFRVDGGFANFEIVLDPEPDLPGNRFNDGKVDPFGRLWAGTMDDAEENASGTLYRLDPDWRCTSVDSGYKVPNGPAFSPDGRTMYHADSALRTLYRFGLTPQGEVAGRSILTRFGPDDGHPDGMTTDSDACLWIAFWDGWCVRQLSPDGDVLRMIDMPVQRPTSCAFGGTQLDTLFVTSARAGLDSTALAGQPDAGGLFSIAGLATGLPATPFSG